MSDKMMTARERVLEFYPYAYSFMDKERCWHIAPRMYYVRTISTGKFPSESEAWEHAASRLPVKDEPKPSTTPELRPSEESACKHCGKKIWRCTDESGLRAGWYHWTSWPSFYCQYPKTHAEPVAQPKSETVGEIKRPRSSSVTCEDGAYHCDGCYGTFDARKIREKR